VLTERLWDEFTVKQCLVVAPKNVAENVWAQEARKWDHTQGLRVSVVTGTATQRRAALRRSADLYVIGRDNLAWLMDELGGLLPFEMVVLDELSSFKSHQTKRWKCIRKAIQNVPYVIGLTGTPAPNGYLDLWPQIFLLDGGERLGRTVGRYRDRYFTPGAHSGHIVYEYKLRIGAQAAIDRELQSLCLSMKSEDWLDLPPVIYNTVPVKMEATARKTYDKMQRDKVLPLLRKQEGFETLDPGDPAALRQMTSAIRGDMAATLAGKLLQMANGAVYDDERNVIPIHDAKLDALAELIDTSAGNNLLVFYAYEHDRDRIIKRFPSARVFRGPGDAEAWNRGEVSLLLCHPASAGHGLNLQAGGHIIVWFGLTWSLELYQQANARLPRPGQTQSVVIHHIVTENTLDERVMQVMAGKNATQEALLRALKGYLNKEENER
jgi:SNF2 family DNA or RNA helicase